MHPEDASSHLKKMELLSTDKRLFLSSAHHLVALFLPLELQFPQIPALGVPLRALLAAALSQELCTGSPGVVDTQPKQRAAVGLAEPTQ